MKIYLLGKIEYLKEELKNKLKPLFLLVSISVLSLPHGASSQVFAYNQKLGPIPEQSIRAYYDGPTLPEIPARKARRTMYIMVSAYNSEPGQTDDTPFITASNTRTRDGIVATNSLPFGTVVRFPDYSGDKEYVVEDRMNKRYYYQMDIWMEHKEDAINFGSQFLRMEIL